MKKAMLIIFSFFNITLFAQQTILFEDFENSGSARFGVIYSAEADALVDIERENYYGVVNLESGANIDYSNIQGVDFYGAQDTDAAMGGGASVNPVVLNWTGINISGFTNLNLSWFVAEDDAANGDEDWDSSSSVRLEIQIDGGGFSNFFAIESAGATGLNTVPRVDTNFDGVGDGVEITDIFNQFNLSVDEGTILDIRLTIEDLDTGDEDIAFDNLLLTGEAGDNEPPMFTCLEAITVPMDANNCEATFDLPVIEVIDNVSSVENILISIVREDGLQITDLYPKGESTITITATDEANNTSEPCIISITVVDEQAPEIICAADIIIVGSDSELLEIEQPTTSDNCMTPILINFERSDNSDLTLNDPFPVGVTSILWTAIDENNNMASCTQTVTITMSQSMANDITNFGIPNQLKGTEIDETLKTVNLIMPFGSDLTSLSPNVSISVDASVSPETGVAQDFSEPVIYAVTAEDGSTQEWTIIVEIQEDNEPPMLECPIDVIVDNDEGECGAIVEFAPTATDNSGSVTVSADFMSGEVFPVGTTLVTVTASDDVGNMTTCNFNVTVEDKVPPILICKDATVELDAGGNVNILITDVFDTLSDNCEVEVLSADKTSFSTGDIGENEVTVTALDVNGNSSSCTAVVTVLPFEENSLSITSFTLINAETNEEIFDLFEGDVFDINDLPTLHLDIRANTTEDVESVRISLDGALSNARTESLMPFALYRDLPVGDYIGEDFVVGQYAVSATPYSENGLGGDMGEPFTVNFELVDSTPTLSVTSFTLINADTDQPINIPLTEGVQIDINSLPTTNLDIRANTTEEVESVRISLDGALTTARTESLPPYALYRDLPIGDYIGEEFVIGEYAVSAVPYSGNGLAGDMGTPLILNFELVDGNPACTTFIVSAEVNSPEFCGIADGSIVLDVMGAEEPVAFEWSHDSELTSSIAQFLVGGTYEVTVTDAKGCAVTIVNEVISPMGIVPTLEAFEPVLVGNPPFALTGGFPEGGTYSGVGVVAGIFDPAIGIGTYEITYVYEDVNFCENSVVRTLEVKAESMSDIISFILVNADNEEDLFPIANGMQIDISSLPTQNLDIRAEAGGDTESVGFELRGTQSITRGESIPPYALFQDLPIGDYIGHTFDLGEYTLSGTPYSQNSLQGETGEVLTIDFEFVDSTPILAVTSFTLINAGNEGELFELNEGMEIFINDIPSLFLDIRANTTEDVESVRLELSGQQSTARTESLEPYALFRDLPIGDYIGNNFEFGEYTVTATPYSGNNLTGEMGTPLSITFIIVDNPELNTLTISPNQATTLARASFKRPTDIKQILVFDMSGRMIESYNPEYIKSGDDYILDVNFYQQGSYIVKMIDNSGVPYQKQMVVKR